MNSFDPEYFQKTKFTREQIASYLKNSRRDLEIAGKDPIAQVRFVFAYQALLKAGIAYLAHAGLKARSVPGHHVRVLSYLGDGLKNEDVLILGNAMRMKRNDDLYGDSGFVSDKEALEYLDFVTTVLRQVEKAVK